MTASSKRFLQTARSDRPCADAGFQTNRPRRPSATAARRNQPSPKWQNGQTDMLAACEANAVTRRARSHIAEDVDDPQAIARALRWDLTDHAGTRKFLGAWQPILLLPRHFTMTGQARAWAEHRRKEVLAELNASEFQKGTRHMKPAAQAELSTRQGPNASSGLFFCVPGRKLISRAGMRWSIPASVVTVCARKAGAANEADAWGRLTGKPGSCLSPRAAGATKRQ